MPAPHNRKRTSATIDGKRKWFYGDTLKEANEAKENYLKMIQRAPNMNQDTTLGQWLAIWLKGARSSITEATFNSYQFQLMNYVLPTMAKVKLVDLQPWMFRNLITELLKKYSNRSVQYALAVVRIALRQAVNDGVLDKSPLIGVKLPKTEKSKASALTKEEAHQLLSVIKNQKHYNMYWVLLYTGLRRSELLGLRIADINEIGSTISIHQTVLKSNGKVYISEKTKTESSRRTITVDPQTLAILKKQKALTYQERLKAKDYENNGLLFCRADGKPYDPQWISKTAKKYGVLINRPDFHLHMLRHTHATLLILAGVHFKVIQNRLGHSTFKETMDTYSHVIPDMEGQIQDKLRKLI
ncbi:site-specific integrase [uncultured Megasphaera sp.]|uniref:tyrosine-type recombinase/integrase n=1 Tax=uncultured Megasphaera sp. TaxID=165188 RepID=UPI00265B3659|nr:site-specific integrase [uncultured Megasphaera sp.]